MSGTLNLTYTDGRGPFVLQAASDETPEGEFKITVITIYQEEGGSVVGLGDTGEGQYSVKAAFTFETREELRIEAEIYSTLPSEFKGDIFPYIHGYYEAEGIACLILEPLSVFAPEEKLITLPFEERCETLSSYLMMTLLTDYLFDYHDYIRCKFLTQLGRMHQVGYCPTLDLGGGNIGLAVDRAIRIGHLKELKKHNCPWDGVWNFGQAAPASEDFKCATLYEAARQCGIWSM